MPKVSVIVPNYNHARFLPQRLDSIVRQTFTDYELLILDDKSTDDSLSVIQPYVDGRRVRLEPNEVNSGGPYRQWNKGLALTSGDYVWIAESDDYADPAFLQTLVDMLDRHVSAGIAMSMTTRVDGDGNMRGGYFDEWEKRPVAAYGPNPFLAGPLFMNGREFCARYMTPWNVIPNASGALFRRSALDAIGGPVTDMKICGDWFTYCKMLMHSDFVSVSEPLSYFRNHTSNVRRRTRATDFIRESLEVRNFLERELGCTPPAKAKQRALDFYAQMLVGAERPAPGSKAPIARYPALVRDSFTLDPRLTFTLLRILAREGAASFVRK